MDSELLKFFQDKILSEVNATSSNNSVLIGYLESFFAVLNSNNQKDEKIKELENRINSLESKANNEFAYRQPTISYGKNTLKLD